MLENPGVFRALTDICFSEIGYTRIFQIFSMLIHQWLKRGIRSKKSETRLMMLMSVDAMS